MCRNIKTLFNFEPPATEQEISASSVTTSDPRDREVEAARAKARSAARFGRTVPLFSPAFCVCYAKTALADWWHENS